VYKLTAILFLVFGSLPGVSQKIIYDFPSSVTEQIRSHNSKYNDSTKFFVLFTVEKSERYAVTIVDFSLTTPNLGLINEVLVSKTNRFARVGNKLIPLVTREDLEFADFGTEETPNSKSEKRKIGKRKVIFNSEHFTITFDKSGKIYPN
jgi:hypothetical protein